MGLEIQPLPYDREALDRYGREGPFLWLWEPEGVSVVLGAGTPVADANLSLCALEGVPVYRRRGGGGAVVLSPGNLVITATYPADQVEFAVQWLLPIVGGIVAALQRMGVAEASVRGLGDVALGDRKILGSSLYANRTTVLYQGSLLWRSDLSLIDRYLPHPSKEPDYRSGRPHRAFVTSLAEAGHQLTWSDLTVALTDSLKQITP